jgi:hypothetical protein
MPSAFITLRMVFVFARIIGDIRSLSSQWVDGIVVCFVTYDYVTFLARLWEISGYWEKAFSTGWVIHHSFISVFRRGLKIPSHSWKFDKAKIKHLIMGNGPPFLPILSMLHIVAVDSRYVNVYCPIYLVTTFHI